MKQRQAIPNDNFITTVITMLNELRRRKGEFQNFKKKRYKKKKLELKNTITEIYKQTHTNTRKSVSDKMK